MFALIVVKPFLTANFLSELPNSIGCFREENEFEEVIKPLIAAMWVDGLCTGGGLSLLIVGVIISYRVFF